MITATGAQIITGILERRGISTVAGIPGGSILPLYDELTRSNIRHVLVRQEQAAGFMAQGMARLTGKAAVCIATSGPGAMNLLTAIADARSDSIPLVAITGQVNRALLGTDAFQETDTFGLSMPICKHSVMVKSAKELLTVLPRAFEIAESGRQGPVLVDVPRDVQLEKVTFDAWPSMTDSLSLNTAPKDLSNSIEESCALYAKSSKSVLFCGGGAVYSQGCAELVQDLSKNYNMPICTSLMGITVAPTNTPLFCGMVGMHGSYTANRVMYESDLIFAVGIRFDDRATGLVAEFCPNAKIVHIDIDAAEINKIYQSTIAIPSDAKVALQALKSGLEKTDGAKDASLRCKNFWQDCITTAQKRMTGIYGKDAMHPAVFLPRIASIYAACNNNAPIVTTDVGQHQMFTAQCFPFTYPRELLTSGSLGTMGFGLPAANGASLQEPKKRVLCFSGDGSIMMNIQELATLAELDANVTVIVFDNQCLGMVRQQQEIIFDKNYSASIYDKNPQLLRIAEGFNIPTFNVETMADLEEVMPKALSGAGPRFVRIAVKQEYNVLPFVTAGKANIDAIGLVN